ncbi:MAG: hypothetical protein RLZZ405_849 [Verrucomicrobiota bacterium]|jgi:hypothetical protein
MCRRLLPLLLSWAVLAAGEVVLPCGRFTLKFDEQGGAVAAVRTADGAGLLRPGARHEGLALVDPDGTATPLPVVRRLADGRVEFAATSGQPAVVFAVRAGERHVAFRPSELRGIEPSQRETLRFTLIGGPDLRLLPLDYMTETTGGAGLLRVTWPALWNRHPSNPPGGFALYERTGDEDEDETLLRLWVEEGLPHPRVDGPWDLARARTWVREWQARFADRSQLILAAKTPTELRAGLALARRANLRQVYLFTDVWRRDSFWPDKHSHVDVNPAVFPRGEADLRAFAEEARAAGMYLALHSISAGIGKSDPRRVGAKPDPRLASWGEGKLVGAVDAKATTLRLRLAPGQVLPSEDPRRGKFPSVGERGATIETNWLKVGEEIVRFDAALRQADGSYELLRCRRGVGTTPAVAHATATTVVGLYAPYGANFVPGNDTTLLAEMAAEYAGLVERCLVEHVEFDGAEIHAYEGFWGYRKYATLVYQGLTRPTTAHDSRGGRPDCWFEYRLNSSKRLMAGACAYSHGNWTVPVALDQASRPASNLLEAHFVLSQGHLGGALGLAKPEPMFGVGVEQFARHGQAEDFLAALRTWTEVNRRLTPEQHRSIAASFRPPTGPRSLNFSHHVRAEAVWVAREHADRFELTPTTVLRRAQGDILWQVGQEHGPVAPKQFALAGQAVELVNPLAERPVDFVVRVLPAFDPAAPTVRPPPARIKSGTGAVGPAVFVAGNAGGSVAPAPGRPTNYDIFPAKPFHAGEASSRQTSFEDGELFVTDAALADGPGRHVDDFPGWSVDLDLTRHRGLACIVEGDGSGALLLFQVGRRDYVIPLDFTGEREIVIPHGEVAWARADWGWRPETKHNDYGNVRRVQVGLPQWSRPGRHQATITRLRALAEIPRPLVDPVVRVGERVLRLRGTVPSGFYLKYENSRALVFDPDWRPAGELAAEGALTAPAGAARYRVDDAADGPAPWLELQFSVRGEPMTVGK